MGMLAKMRIQFGLQEVYSSLFHVAMSKSSARSYYVLEWVFLSKLFLIWSCDS